MVLRNECSHSLIAEGSARYRELQQFAEITWSVRKERRPDLSSGSLVPEERSVMIKASQLLGNDEILPLVTVWSELKVIRLFEVRQKVKGKCQVASVCLSRNHT